MTKFPNNEIGIEKFLQVNYVTNNVRHSPGGHQCELPSWDPSSAFAACPGDV